MIAIVGNNLDQAARHSHGCLPFSTGVLSDAISCREVGLHSICSASGVGMHIRSQSMTVLTVSAFLHQPTQPLKLLEAEPSGLDGRCFITMAVSMLISTCHLDCSVHQLPLRDGTWMCQMTPPSKTRCREHRTAEHSWCSHLEGASVLCTCKSHARSRQPRLTVQDIDEIAWGLG